LSQAGQEAAGEEAAGEEGERLRCGGFIHFHVIPLFAVKFFTDDN
jgi:hypothetical protein